MRQVGRQIPRLQHPETDFPQRFNVRIEAEIGVKEQPVVHELPRRRADVRFGLGEIVENQRPAGFQHPVGFPQRLHLFRYMVDGGLAPHMGKGAVGKGQFGGRRLFKCQPAGQFGRPRQRGDGVFHPHAAEVNARNPGAGGAAQPGGGGAVAAAHIQHPRGFVNAGAFYHQLVEADAGGEKLLPDAAAVAAIAVAALAVKHAPMHAAVRIPHRAVDDILGVVVLLRFLFGKAMLRFHKDTLPMCCPGCGTARRRRGYLTQRYCAQPSSSLRTALTILR